VIIGIVAVARNLAIGRQGKLPWHYSADLKFFKETTMASAIVMGAKTWRSIGKALPGRINIVLSRTGDIDAPQEVTIFDSKDAAVDLANDSNVDLYVIGGAQVFNDFAPQIGRWIVTEVPIIVEDADTFMPENFLDGFHVESTRDLGDGLVVRSYTGDRRK
jgi:dihydrofolate reductase